MATKKKMLQAAAGNAGGAGLDIDEVFSTYLYTGTSGSPGVTATNGIDLAGEGGLVWLKSRSNSVNHSLFDTERGGNSNLATNVNDGSGSLQMDVFGGTVFNSDGFFLRSGNGTIEASGYDYASWTFRKAPKFFDVVTYSGNSTPRTISHNLGTTVGTILIKKTSAAADWIVYHRSTGATDYLELNNDSVVNTYNMWNNTAPTSTEFSLSGYQKVNETGHTYVAYLFAHNDGDGEFGPDGDADVIKCGSYTGNGTVGQEINLGFEPQFVMAKITSTTGNWYIQDAMRTMTGNGSPTLKPNSSDAEYNSNGYSEGNIELTPTGFRLDTDDQGGGNGSGDTYIYMAIRRGPLAPPESATEVFAVDTATQDSTAETHALSYYDSGWFFKRTGGDAGMSTQRILPNRISFETGQYASLYWDAGLDNNQGKYFAYNSDPTVNYFLKRAPGFFDHLAYAGTGSVNTHQHNLTVQPEMMWVRKLNTSSADAFVYHKDLSASTEITLNTNTPSTNANIWNNTRPTDAVFTVGTSSSINDNEGFVNFYAMLFASVSGVSKVGSYTGNGAASQNIDCGFTSGARFVLLKRTTTGTNYNSNWQIWDATRGIVSGNDPLIYLTTTQTEITDEDFIDPYSAGFTILDNGTSGANVSGASYIFYAIA